MKFFWSKSTMPKPGMAWASSAGSLLTSAWVANVGAANGFSSLAFHHAQETFRLPGVVMAAAPIYAMGKSDPVGLKRQVLYRLFSILVALVAAVYVI
jgi:hypothetical protein